MKKILHIQTILPEKYNSKFINFVQKYLTDYDHAYFPLSFVKGAKEISGADILLEEYGKGKLQRIRSLYKLMRSSEYDLIMIHCFTQVPLFLPLLRLSNVGKKCAWMTWGSDVYFFQNKSNNIKDRFREWIRSITFKKVAFVNAFLPGEHDLIKIHYCPQSVFYALNYPLPLSVDSLPQTTVQSKKDKLKIVVGNSADPTNNHILMLDALEHLKGKVSIYCPLSYQGTSDYIDYVITYGRQLFGDDFEAETNFLSPELYARKIANIDVACYYHNRQQALGNILYYLSKSVPVFLRSDVLSYEFLKEMHVSVFDALQLKNQSFNDLTAITLEAQNNKYNITALKQFSDENTAIRWRIGIQSMLARVPKYQ